VYIQYIVQTITFVPFKCTLILLFSVKKISHILSCNDCAFIIVLGVDASENIIIHSPLCIIAYRRRGGSMVGGEVAQWWRRGGSMVEERWLNGSAPDCKSVVLGSNPAPPQHMTNSISPEVSSHLG
jgi:hypothetical protein